MNKSVGMVFVVAFTLLSRPSFCDELDKSFKCPESFATDSERNETNKQFLESVSKLHPDWTIDNLIEYRLQLLNKHNCQETLNNFSASKKEKEDQIDITTLAGNMFVAYNNGGITAMTNRENACWENMSQHDISTAKACFITLWSGVIVESTIATSKGGIPAPIYSPNIARERAMDIMAKYGLSDSEIESIGQYASDNLNVIVSGLINAGMR